MSNDLPGQRAAAQRGPGPADLIEPPGTRPKLALAVLMLVYACNQLDRAIISVVMDPVKREFLLTDTQLGLLSGLAFATFFALAGIPLGMLADRVNRRNLIAACLLVWSGMTAACGATTSFIGLLLARMGVGAGEAGGGPAAMAMISDFFPAKQRARALAFYYLSSSIGVMLALVVGGKIVAAYGWRMAFLAAAAPGIVLATVLMLTVKEPRRGQSDLATAEARRTPALRTVLHFIARQKSLLHLCAGITLSAMATVGVLMWMPSFLLRSHGMAMAEAGRVVGYFFGAVSIIGILAGGFITDRMARLDPLWRTRLLSLAALLCAPALSITVLTPSSTLVVFFFSLWAISSSFWYGPGYALCQTLVGIRMRATAASLLYLLTNLVSAGLGPQVVGLLSDAMHARLGGQSLRYAMLALVGLHAWAALHLMLSGKTVAADLERAARS